MKKILLSLLFITSVVKISKLSAYCIYNYSNDEPITMFIFSKEGGKSKTPSKIIRMLYKKNKHSVYPKRGKKCWNWKKTSKSATRTQVWYWLAFTGVNKWRTIGSPKLGEGYFPIGGAIVFSGYDENAKAKFDIYYDGKPWKFRKNPWHWSKKNRPWKTYKRQR